MEPAPFSALEVSDEQRRAIFEGKWNEGGFHFANECFNDLATNHAASELASEFIRSKIREIVKDPATADLLSPKTYSFNGKRVPTGHGYYDAFNLDHVRLVDTASDPITAITPTGVRVGEVTYELDVLIFATGFDAMTGTLTNIDIIGRDGITLRDKWARDGLRSNLGIGVHGFRGYASCGSKGKHADDFCFAGDHPVAGTAGRPGDVSLEHPDRQAADGALGFAPR